jgi:hypothetical protein
MKKLQVLKMYRSLTAVGSAIVFAGDGSLSTISNSGRSLPPFDSAVGIQPSFEMVV